VSFAALFAEDANFIHIFGGQLDGRTAIEAHAEQGTVQGQTGAMDLVVQSLLEDRCRLKFHRESRRLPAYALTVAKSEPKIKLAEDQSTLRLPKMGPGIFEADGLDLATFAQLYLSK